MLAAADDAVCTVASAVRRDGRLAFSVLKSLGIADRPTPGSTNPDEIKDRMEIEERRAEAARGEELFYASIGQGRVKRDGTPSTADLVEELKKMKAKR